MSAPNPKFTDDEPRELPRCVRAFGPVREIVALDRVPVDLDALERKVIRNRLDDLCALLNELTWGEMTEFAAGIEANAPNIHRWSNARNEPAQLLTGTARGYCRAMAQDADGEACRESRDAQL